MHLTKHCLGQRPPEWSLLCCARWRWRRPGVSCCPLLLSLSWWDDGRWCVHRQKGQKRLRTCACRVPSVWVDWMDDSVARWRRTRSRSLAVAPDRGGSQAGTGREATVTYYTYSAARLRGRPWAPRIVRAQLVSWKIFRIKNAVIF